MKPRRPGLSLIVAGLLGILFFWITDPHYGLIGASGKNSIEAAHQSLLGTIIGFVGSIVVLLIGLWLRFE